MEIDRRATLAGLAATIAGVAPAAAQATSRPRNTVPDDALFAAARQDASGRYSAAIFRGDNGDDVKAVTLPGRGHDATFCATTGRCVVFARRPGNFAVAFSAGGSDVVRFTTPEDRHFYGHGTFSRDGRLLYATENDFAAGTGVVGVYDVAAGFRRIGELPSFGIGPHDMALLRGATVLVVANGGLREHPDIGGGRRVLNAGAIESSLAYIDTTTGDLIERHALPDLPALSLRHLDIGAGDTVILGAQRHGLAGEPTPLVFRHRRQGDLEAIALPPASQAALSGYISSVAVDRAGSTALVTSSKGGLAIAFDISTGQQRFSVEAVDISGAAATQGGGFLLTTGQGGIASTSATRSPIVTPRAKPTRWHWDNHAAARR